MATPKHQAPDTAAVLSSREDLGHGYYVLGFALSAPVAAQAGQFAMLRPAAWGAAPLLPRPMSLLQGGSEPQVLVKAVGEGTRRIVEQPLGASFTLLGPLGRPWTLPPRGARPIFVAGGVGIAPLIFLARALHEPKLALEGPSSAATRLAERPIVLYGGRTADDLPLASSAQAFADLEIATEDGSGGARGRVTALLEDHLRRPEPGSPKLTLYACGPHAMLSAVAAIAAEHQVPCQVSLEARMACGYGVCLGCAIPRASGGYLYACADGPCVSAYEVDWAACNAP